MSKARILVVDDEPAVLKVLVTRLQLAGYEVFLTGLFAPFICSQLIRMFKFSRRKLW